MQHENEAPGEDVVEKTGDWEWDYGEDWEDKQVLVFRSKDRCDSKGEVLADEDETDNFSIWCYECNSEINVNTHKKLLEVVELVKKTRDKPADNNNKSTVVSPLGSSLVSYSSNNNKLSQPTTLSLNHQVHNLNHSPSPLVLLV